MTNKTYGKIVVMSFIRVMKNKDKYTVIKNQLKKLSSLPLSDNPFCGISSIDNLGDKLYTFSLKQYKENKRSNDEYEFITVLVNNLLHFIYEPICEEKMNLGIIGQEIFDLACYRIYGNKYIQDMDKLNNGAKRPETAEEAMLISEYMSLIHSGRDISWEEFLDYKNNECDEEENNSPLRRVRNSRPMNNETSDSFLLDELMRYLTIR